MSQLRSLEKRFDSPGYHMPELLRVAFTMGTHARLGGACKHIEMPDELVRRVLEICAALPRVPRGAPTAPLLAVPLYQPDLQTFIQETRALAPNDLWITGPFRFHADPHPHNGNPAFEAGSWPEGPTLLWRDTAYSTAALPDGQESYLIVVQIHFSVPVLPVGDDGMVDLSGLPNVWRSAAKLPGLRVPLTEYTELIPGGYNHNLEMLHGGILQYKRIVQGNASTTLRDVWHATAHAEGWGACLAQYDRHFPGDLGDRTVAAHMEHIAPDSDSENDDFVTDEEIVFYREGGGYVVELTFPCV